jgi:tetratricopeptide (TPR) repeat protein
MTSANNIRPSQANTTFPTTLGNSPKEQHYKNKFIAALRFGNPQRHHMLKECIEAYPYFLEARYWLAISVGYYWRDVRRSIEHLKVIIDWTSKPEKYVQCQCDSENFRRTTDSLANSINNNNNNNNNNTFQCLNQNRPLLDNREYLHSMATIELFSIESKDCEAHLQMLTEELERPCWSEDQIGEIYYFRAFVWDALGNLTNALADMEASIARNYRLETSYRQRASFLQELDNHPEEKVKECYECALNCRRCNIALVSYAAHLSSSDPQKAVALLEEAIERAPEDASAYEELISHSKEDNLRIERCNLAIERDPDLFFDYPTRMLAAVYADQGKYKQVLRLLIPRYVLLLQGDHCDCHFQ